MKHQLGWISDTLLHAAMRLKGRPLSVVATRQYGHVILAPSSRGNLGDEAMLTSTVQNVMEQSHRPVTILTHKDEDDWSDIQPVIRQVSIQGYFSAIGFRKSLAVLETVFSAADSFSILGADVMDGAYSRTRTFRRLAMAEYAIRMGVPTRILGFSYSDKANGAASQYLSTLSAKMELFARDEYSCQRLAALARGPLHLVADTAFLLKPADPPGSTVAGAIDFIGAAHDAGRKVIAFNANPLGSSMSAGATRGNQKVTGLDGLVSRHVERLLALDSSLNLVFVPHDPREPHNDRDLLQRIFDAQTAENKRRIYLAFDRLTARDVKMICGACDLSVTGRMHMGIASLGAGTPCLFLDFQGKVRGLLRHFEIDDMVFDWDVYSNPEAFSDFVLTHLANSATTRAHIAARRAKVLELAMRNFTGFSDITTGSRHEGYTQELTHGDSEAIDKAKAE